MGLILLITYDDGPSIWWKETNIGKQKTLVTGAQPSAKKLLESITMMKMVKVYPLIPLKKYYDDEDGKCLSVNSL